MPTILLIEDDPAIAHSLRLGLEREGYAVLWASTGAAGFQLALNSVHLILLDLRLPDGSGLDVCRRIRQHGLRMPILMLTVQAEEIDRIVGLEMGADDYIAKPFSLRELLARIRAHLRRAYGEFSGEAAPGGHLLYAGEVTIDLARSQATRGSQPLPLTPTEFRLLAHLAQHPRQAFTRAQLVEAVWNHPADPESEKAVNVHIRRLREKVETDPSRPTLLLTVPGVGYRLEP